MLRHSGSQFSGQAMMFQMIVDELNSKGWSLTTFDISQSKKKSRRMNGCFGVSRLLDFIWLLPRVWTCLVFNSHRVLYITTAQSFWGFMRDVAIIWPAAILGHRVVCHQFGGNYAPFYASLKPWGRRLVQSVLSRVAAIIVEGNWVREQYSFLDNYRDIVRVVPNGLPERSVAFVRQAKHYPHGETFELLYLSNMMETKGYWDVLLAVEMLVKQRGRSVRCAFVGEFLSSPDARMHRRPEDARSAFFEYIASRQLSEYVRYSERMAGKEKTHAFQRAHVFLLPSYYINEGQPVSILEAMAYGAVVIATNYRLIPTMVADNETGILVPPGDPEAIATAVEHLMDNPDVFETMSRAALERYDKHFGGDRFCEAIERILGESSGLARCR